MKLQIKLTYITSHAGNAVFVCLFLAQPPPVGQGLLLIHEVSREHTTTHQLVGLLWMSDQLIRDLYLTTLTKDIHAPGMIRSHDLSR